MAHVNKTPRESASGAWQIGDVLENADFYRPLLERLQKQAYNKHDGIHEYIFNPVPGFVVRDETVKKKQLLFSPSVTGFIYINHASRRFVAKIRNDLYPQKNKGRYK